MLVTEQRLQIGVILENTLRLRGLGVLFGKSADFFAMLPTEAVRRNDLSMVVLDGTEQLFPLLAAFRRARAGLRILVLGESTDPKYISRVIAAGAKGYLSHMASEREMETAIQVVADGSIWAPRKVLSSLIDTLSSSEPSRPEYVQFTPRERDLLHHLVRGLSDREIARELGITLRTVQTMVRGLLLRVGVTNRVALTVYVLERHVLH